MIEVPLTRGMVALIDDEDYSLVRSYTWSAIRSSQTFYAIRNTRNQAGNHSTQGMHRLLTGYSLTDHVNGNGLDNRRANLRPASGAQNAMNRRLRSDNTSGFKGVSRNNGRGRPWVAQILAGRRMHLGMFDTAEAAAAAYDAAAVEFFGEFAVTNFPQEESA